MKSPNRSSRHCSTPPKWRPSRGTDLQMHGSARSSDGWRLPVSVAAMFSTVLDTAQAAAGYAGTSVAKADKQAITWSRQKLEDFGCFTPEGMAKLKKGGSPTITKGGHGASQSPSITFCPARSCRNSPPGSTTSKPSRPAKTGPSPPRLESENWSWPDAGNGKACFPPQAWRRRNQHLSRQPSGSLDRHGKRQSNFASGCCVNAFSCWVIPGIELWRLAVLLQPVTVGATFTGH